MLEAYRHHVAERAALGIPPLPLSAQQTADVIELLKNPPAGEAEFLLDLITHRVRVPVVHVLEVIDVHEHHRQQRPVRRARTGVPRKL